jgi:uncharacterized protein (TIGR04255 family)
MVQLRADLSNVALALGQAIFSDYPIYSEQKEMQVVLTSGGASQQASGTVFQFSSIDDNWRVALSESFLTLDARKYTSKSDFCARFTKILQSLSEIIEIPYASRVGFRYVNRVDDPNEYKRIGDLVNPHVMGGGSVPLANNAGLMHSVCESVFAVGGHKLLTRWAHVPPGSTTDPTIEPSARLSWTLDLDAFTEGQFGFDPGKLVTLAEELSTISYKFFRWAVTDEFLRAYGGDV